MTDVGQVRKLVVAAVAGDVSAVGALAGFDRHLVAETAFLPGQLMLGVDAVIRAIEARRAGRISDTELSLWAWFVSRGYVPGAEGGPIRPIPIDYVVTDEDRIVEVLSRLRELGDSVDGVLDTDEAEALLRRLYSG